MQTIEKLCKLWYNIFCLQNDEYKEFKRREISNKLKYNINNNNLSEAFRKISQELEEATDEMNKLLLIDYKYCKMKIDLGALKTIVEELKKEKIDIKKEQKILIRYNGHPYITLNLGLLSILTKNVIYLDCSECMLGVNSLIADIINRVLNTFKTDNLIYINDKMNKGLKDFDKIICIDDINQYNKYLCNNNQQAKFYVLNYLDFYSDSDDFDELTELIYAYAECNGIPVESYSELNINEALPMMKNGLGKMVVVLSNSEQTKKNFKENINNKSLFINQNPFNQAIKLLGKEIFQI